eukprot:4919620-Prorocentrum_lima.AAC.1
MDDADAVGDAALGRGGDKEAHIPGGHQHLQKADCLLGPRLPGPRLLAAHRAFTHTHRKVAVQRGKLAHQDRRARAQ